MDKSKVDYVDKVVRVNMVEKLDKDKVEFLVPSRGPI